MQQEYAAKAKDPHIVTMNRPARQRRQPARQERQPARQAAERRSAAPLLYLRALPSWLPSAAAAALLVTGLAVRGVAGAAALGVLAAFLSWLAFLSWPRLSGQARLLRVAAIICLVAITVAVAVR